jgi:hypothetical protein
MATYITNYAELLHDIPAGSWVAISEAQQKVIAFGQDACAVLKQSRENGEPRPFMVRVPEKNFGLFLERFGFLLNPA